MSASTDHLPFLPQHIKLKQARIEAGLTQKQAAELSGVPQPNISTIEKGRGCTSATFERLIRAYTEHMGHAPVALGAVEGVIGIVGRTAGKLVPVDIAAEPTPVEWIAHGYVARGHVTMIAGQAGRGKSALTQTLAVALAKGDRYAAGMELVGRRQRVLIMDAENVMVISEDNVQASLIQSRLQSFGLTDERDQSQVLAVGSSGFCLDKDFASLDGMLSDLTDAGDKPDVVILDSFTSLWSGNENVVDHVNSVLYKLNRLAVLHNVAVVLIHHASKDGETFRGSSAIAGAIAAVFTFYSDDDSEEEYGPTARVLKCYKMRIAAEPRPLIVYSGPLGKIVAEAPGRDE